MNLLFYQQPRPLSPHMHGSWQMRQGGYGFTTQANAVPVVLNEFAAVSRHYPLVFAADTKAPLCILGLESSKLFVTDSGWSNEVYIPAYVRRYPFLSMAFESNAHAVLAIDGASEQFVPNAIDNEAAALFERSAPTALTKRMLSFCETFRRDQIETLAWSEALNQQGLLHEQQAQVVLPGGRKIALQGFRTVDAQKLAQLDDTVVVNWHRKGWLGWIYLHLASLQRFEDLFARQAQREPLDAAAEQT